MSFYMAPDTTMDENARSGTKEKKFYAIVLHHGSRAARAACLPAMYASATATHQLIA